MAEPALSEPAPRQPQVIVVTTAMLVFISFWRAAAIVLCDMASTAYYIGGIVEQAIGKAAPWYIGAVMLFAYAVRGVYIESCAMFVRGGVYRVVKEAMGGTLAKLSVSALMFDYVLTGPISGVSAGQYIVGLAERAAEGGARARSRIPPGARVRGHRRRDHALLLAPEHPRHRGVERQGDEDHGRHDGDDRGHDRSGVALTIWMRGATLPPFDAALQRRIAGLAGRHGHGRSRSAPSASSSPSVTRSWR